MSSEMINTNGQLVTPAPQQATLLEMRSNPKRFPRLNTYTREQAVVEMAKIVSQAFLYKGQSADATNIQFISCSLVDELQADHQKVGSKYISFAEISRIVRRAVLTQDMFGISVASLYRVIIDYIKGEGHELDKKADKTPVTDIDTMDHPALMAYTGALLKNSKI